MGHRCHSLNFMAVGIFERLCRWWAHSCPAGHRHRRRGDPSDSGTKGIVAIWTLVGAGEVFGKEVAYRSGKVLPKFTIP